MDAAAASDRLVDYIESFARETITNQNLGTLVLRIGPGARRLSQAVGPCLDFAYSKKLETSKVRSRDLGRLPVTRLVSRRSRASNAQTIRAFLLASATAATFLLRRWTTKVAPEI